MAIELAARREAAVRGVIVENTFTSIEDLVRPGPTPFMGVGPASWRIADRRSLSPARLGRRASSALAKLWSNVSRRVGGNV